MEIHLKLSVIDVQLRIYTRYANNVHATRATTNSETNNDNDDICITLSRDIKLLWRDFDGDVSAFIAHVISSPPLLAY